MGRTEYPCIKKTMVWFEPESNRVTCLQRSIFVGFHLMNTQHHQFMVGVANANLGKELLGVVRTLRYFFGTWAIRDTRRMKLCKGQTIVGRFRRCRPRLGFWCRVNKSIWITSIRFGFILSSRTIVFIFS